LPEKINKIPEFYMIIARKIFSTIFEGGGRGYVPHSLHHPVSYAYDSHGIDITFTPGDTV